MVKKSEAMSYPTRESIEFIAIVHEPIDKELVAYPRFLKLRKKMRNGKQRLLMILMTYLYKEVLESSLLL